MYVAALDKNIPKKENYSDLQCDRALQNQMSTVIPTPI